MDVYQCPDCELKFRLATELQQHLALEHPNFHVDSKTLEGALLAASHRHRHQRSHPAGRDKNSE